MARGHSLRPAVARARRVDGRALTVFLLALLLFSSFEFLGVVHAAPPELSVVALIMTSPYPLGSGPTGVTYDSGKGEVFVASNGNGTVSVISDATNTTVAKVPVGSNPSYAAYDSGKGEVFVTNTRSNTTSVISDATNAVVATIPVGTFPLGVAYDSGKGEVFVTNAFDGTISVISDATNTVVATVHVGSGPFSGPWGVAYDSARGEVYVVNKIDFTVSVISDATNAVVATIPVGRYPMGVAYDSGKGEVFVTTTRGYGGPPGHDNVSVISDATKTVVAEIPVGDGPIDLAYDSGKGEIFVACLHDYVSVISDTSNTVVATVDGETQTAGAAYDNVKGEVFVTNISDGTVGVISDETNTVVYTIDGRSHPWGVTYDSAMGEVFVTNSGTGSVSVISDLTNTVVANIPVGPFPWNSVYDSGKGEVFVTTGFGLLAGRSTSVGTVSVISDASNTVIATVDVGSDPEGLAYDSAKGEVFVTNTGSNTTSVISDSTNTVVATIPVGRYPMGVAYDSGKGEVFVANSFDGTISVISDATNTVVATISGVPSVQGLAYDSAKGEIFTANGQENTVSVISDSTNSVVKTISTDGYAWDLAYESDRGQVLAAVLGGTQGSVSGVVAISDATNTVVAASGGTFVEAAYDSGMREIFATSLDDADHVYVLSTTSVSTALSSSSIPVGGSVRDSAKLNGITSNAGGTVTYEYYSGSACSGKATVVGSPVTVTNGVVPDSISKSFGSAGPYSWKAVYSGDASNRPAVGQCEPLTVKASPSIATTLSHLTISAGKSVYDSATLKGGFQAGGTVTYEYFSGGTCSGTPVKVGSAVKVTNGVIPNSASRVFNKVGTYSWKVVYSGDARNKGAASPCEKLTVLKATTLPTHTTITCTKSSFAVGTKATCTATVTGSYSSHTGTITWLKLSGTGRGTFSPSTCTLSSGKCSVTFTAKVAGSITIEAIYSGDTHNPWSYGTRVLKMT